MTLDELDSLLHEWGRFCGERPVRDEFEGEVNDGGPGGYGTNPIATAMEFAPRKRDSYLSQELARRPGARRRLIPGKDGELVEEIQPGWAVPVMPARGTRQAIYGMGELARQRRPLPHNVAIVERAALDLHRIDTLRGLSLRVHYCTLGDLDEKAAKVSLRLGSPVKVRAYRDAVREAKFWLLGRLAA